MEFLWKLRLIPKHDSRFQKNLRHIRRVRARSNVERKGDQKTMRRRGGQEIERAKGKPAPPRRASPTLERKPSQPEIPTKKKFRSE